MIKKIITLILLLHSYFSFSQIANDSLVNSIKNAEKVLLTSHEDFNPMLDQGGKENTEFRALLKIENKSKRIWRKIQRRRKKMDKKRKIFRPLLKNGKPNNSIIREKTELDEALKQELIEVISKPKKDSLVYDGNYCFEPHHTLFLYKKKKWSYIDLCFGCDKYSYSKDLKINTDEFLPTYEDWRNLEDFFRKLNLNYKMRVKK